MDIIARKIADAGKQNTGCAVAPVFARKKLSAAARQLDKASGGLVSNALQNGEISGQAGETLMLHLHGNKPVRRILLVGCGSPAKLNADAGRKIIAAVLRAIRGSKTRDASIHLAELQGDELDLSLVCERLGRTAAIDSYSYRETVSKPKPALAVTKLLVNCGDNLSIAKANAALKRDNSWAWASTWPATWATCPATSARRPTSPAKPGSWPGNTVN